MSSSTSELERIAANFNSRLENDIFSKAISDSQNLKSAISLEVNDNSRNQSEVSNPIENQYWRNFLTILIEIQTNKNLWDYFIPEDVFVFSSFADLPTEAQKLYVRLLNRKYTWLKVSSLNYSEISPDLEPIVNILIEKQFLTSDVKGEEINSLLDLLTLPELKTLCKNFRLKNDGKKEALAKSLIDFSFKQKNLFAGVAKDIKTVMKEKVVANLGRMVKLSSKPRQLFLRTMLLHSLPLAAEMDMEGKIPVLNTMSRVNAKQIIYPDYSLRPMQKIFMSREALVRFQNALELEASIKGKMINKSLDEVATLYDVAIANFKELIENETIRQEDANLPLFLRSYSAGSVLAKAVFFCVECLRMKKMYPEMIATFQTLLSQKIYLPNYHGRWYDQLALIYHHHMKNVPMAVELLLEAMTVTSLNPIDQILLSNRGSLIVNRKQKSNADVSKNSTLASMLTSVKDPPEMVIQARCIQSKIGGGSRGSKMSYINETEEGIGEILSSVEETVIMHHRQFGYDQGLHAENAISTSLFGIFLWDIIYATDVPNVFICPYQTRPLDLKSGEFYSNRKEAVEQRIAEIEELWSIEEINSHVERIWSQEKGKESLVSWRTFEDLKLFEIVMECIGRKVISKICKRMAEEYPIARKGFPDILIWNQTTKKCKFIEVKGPGDRLSPYQRSWLAFLNTSGADALVCYVKTIGAKSLKRKSDTSDNTDSLDRDDPIVID